MPKYEFLIQGKDRPDTPAGPSIKEGDLVAVKPYPCDWGTGPIARGLVIIADLNMEYKELVTLLRGGVYREIATEDLWSESDVWQAITSQTHTKDEFERIYKRRFSLSLNTIKTVAISDLDLTKVRNFNIRYQPFKSDVQLVQKFDGVGGNEYLTEDDVDTVSSVASKDQEFSFDLDLVQPIILDKITNTNIRLNNI
jgi:hypothetical protein